MPAKTHGMSRKDDGTATKEYKAWCGIKSRCTNPNNQYWHCYGGRGITMHQGWLDSFQEFLEYVGHAPSEEHSIGRIDNDGMYEPGNVEWQTIEAQNSNKRNLPRKSWKTDPVREKVLSLSSAGISTRKIAEVVGVGKTSVWKIVNGQD